MWEFVDRIIYINLRKREDRNERMIQTIIPNFGDHVVHRFNAIEDPNGAIGCYLSHIAVLNEAIDLNVKNVLVLEDDISWNKYEENYEKLKQWSNIHYDVIMLGGTAVQRSGDKVINANCSHGYLVNNHYFKTLLNTFKEGLETLSNDQLNHGSYALDQYWKVAQRKDNWFILQPCMLYQISDYSDIDDKYKPTDMRQAF